MYTQVLTACQPEAEKVAFLWYLLLSFCALYSIVHEVFQFRKCLLDFWYGSWAINEFALCRIELNVWNSCSLGGDTMIQCTDIPVDMTRWAKAMKQFSPSLKASQAHSGPTEGLVRITNWMHAYSQKSRGFFWDHTYKNIALITCQYFTQSHIQRTYQGIFGHKGK